MSWDLDHVEADTLAALLSPDLEQVDRYQPDELRAILAERLDKPGGKELARLQSEEASEPIETTFRDLLEAQSPRLGPLILLKRFGKASRLGLAPPLPREVSTVLYFASIAAALVRCQQRITGLDDASLRAGLKWGENLPWVEEGLRQLLAEARRSVERTASRS